MDNVGKIEKIYSLSNMQAGMLFHALLDKDSQAYFEQMSYTIHGDVDVDAFERGFNYLVRRYDILRTNFIYKNLQKPKQVVLKERKVHVDFHDLSLLDEREKSNFIKEYKDKEREKGFDLARDVLIKLSVLKTGEKNYEVVWSHHHILMDGWCMGIIIKEFLKVYQSFRESKPLNLEKTYPYRDYIAWLEKQDKEEAEDYWGKYLAAYEQKAGLPKKANIKKEGYIQKNITFTLDEELTGKLEQTAANHKVTLNTIFQSIWSILLQRYNNTEDVVFGSVVSGRPSEITGIENMVGLFINTVPVRIRSEEGSTFGALLKQIQEAALKSDKYCYLSLAEIQANTELKQELIDHIIVFENYPIEKAIIGANTADLKLQIDQVEAFEQTNYDFNVIVTLDSKLSVKLSFNGLIYDEDLIKRIGRHFEEAARTVVVNSNILINKIELLSEEEKQQILYEFNDTQINYPKDKTIQQLFEEQVERTPEAIAVAFENQELTYSQLNKRANQIAWYLRKKGVGHDMIVGVLMQRSTDAIAAILGVLKAGGAILPIDPQYPNNRILSMLDDSEVSIVLAINGEIRNLPVIELQNIKNTKINQVSAEREIVLLDTVSQQLSVENDQNPGRVSNPENLLYVIYTSGSTGKPKGVMLENRNLLNLILYEFDRSGIDFSGKVLQFTTLCFDVSYQEIFSTLLSGGQLCIVDEECKSDVVQLFKYIEENEIGVIFLPTAFLKFIFKDQEYVKMIPGCIRHIITAGEQLIVTKALYEYMSQQKVLLHNHYGPSETHVVTTMTIKPGAAYEELPPIGRPISNTQIYILNRERIPQPIGVAGELYISGESVGRGYLNNPDLTAEKFISNLIISGTRTYKTGDLARRLPDGNIQYLGRIDDQVKIRGFRIELGEIESRLLKHEDIKEAAVTAREDHDGGRYLCAYFVAVKPLNVADIRRHLSEELPDYMIPSYFVQLEKLPLTPNGKVDRKALPEPEGGHNTGIEYIAPQNEIEEKLVSVWQKVLEVKKIGIKDNFFELGGHSLKATVVASQVAKLFNIELPLREIFRTPTIKELAQYIKGAESSIYTSIGPVEEREYYPVSPAQKRLYIIDRLEGAGTGYNMPGVLTMKGGLDKERFEAAFKELIKRHESLRTSFEMAEGEPVQRVHAEVEFTIAYREAAEEEIDTIIKDFIYPFDLGKAPLFRVGLVKIEKDKHILVFDIHHIISDGVSMEILVREFISLYEGQNLPELRIRYRDYSVWQKELFCSGAIERQEQYWISAFGGEIPVLNMPTDHIRPAVQSFEGDSISFNLTPEQAEKLKKLAMETGSTLYMVLLAAYNVLLLKYTGQGDIIVGSPVAGRPHADLEGIIGVFINTLGMRNYPEGNKTFLEFLQEVRENALRAYENQDYQFEELVDKLNLKKDFSRNPLFDTMFVLQNAGNSRIEIRDLRIEPYRFANKIAKFDLTLKAAEDGRGINLVLEYCTKLFRPETPRRMAGHFVRIVEEVVKNPGIRLSEIELLSAEEKQQILYEFNNTRTEYAKDRTIEQLFEEQVGKTPDNIAVVYEGEQLTYRELDRKASQLARVLRQKGVGPGCIVGIMVERSLEMVVGILGILKAGGAYLPIDPDYPRSRIEFILRDSAAGILLTYKNLSVKLDFDGIVINMEDIPDNTGGRMTMNCGPTPQDPAYVIYTSGSAGNPKGVMIKHQSVINLVAGLETNIYGCYQGELRVALLAPYIFDASVKQIFAALLLGHSLYILPKDTVINGTELIRYYREHKIDISDGTPAHLSILADNLANEPLNVKRFIIGGDVLSLETVKNFYHRIYGCKPRITNVYGPTECCVDSTHFSFSEESLNELNKIPIGKPWVNFKIYILDSSKKIVPAGIFGEIYIGGPGLAAGYMNQPDLTAQSFVDNPWIPGEKMYKTGDSARWLPDGNIEFAGRIDQQVKIRGYRIELGEIESRLLKHEDIKEAVVTAREDTSGSKYLCAYFAAVKPLTVTEIRRHLSEKLPDYMIPSFFVQMEKLPLTPNGKIDRKALPEPEGCINTGVEYAAPGNEMEEKLALIWKDVLGAERIGMNDNFFELGGNSLKVVRLIMKVNEKFLITYPMKEIFAYPTIKEMAKTILIASNLNSDDSMMLLNMSRDKKIFAFPPAGAYGLAFWSLAQLLEEYSVYAFNFIEKESRIMDYVRLILNTEPDGPYVLFGYSAGGNIAFEVAKELEKQGHKVSDIILLDTYRWLPDQFLKEADIKQKAAKIADVVSDQLKLNGFKGDLEGISNKISRYLEYTYKLMNRRNCTGKVHANIHLIKAEDVFENMSASERDNQWVTATFGEFNKYQGFGVHKAMLDEIFIKNNAALIQQILHLAPKMHRL